MEFFSHPSPHKQQRPFKAACNHTWETGSGKGNYSEGQNTRHKEVVRLSFLGLGHLVCSVWWWRGSRRVFLWLGEVLSDDLSGLRGDPVGKTDRKLHNEVSALCRVLGKWQAFPSESLHRPWLDDVVTGERDDAVFQRGNANCAATQRLKKSRLRGLISLVGIKCHVYLYDLMFPWSKNYLYIFSQEVILRSTCFCTCDVSLPGRLLWYRPQHCGVYRIAFGLKTLGKHDLVAGNFSGLYDAVAVCVSVWGAAHCTGD